MRFVNIALAAVIALVGCAIVYYVVKMEPSHAAVEEEGADKGKEAAGEHVDGLQHVEFDETTAKKNNLEYAKVGSHTIQGTIRLPGEIALDGNRVVHVVPRLSGVAREVSKNLGDDVKKGEVLAIIDSRELADSKSDYLAAMGRRSLAQTRFEREKDLFAQKISPQEDYLSARQSMEEDDINVRSAEQKLRSLGLSDEQLADVRNRKETSLTGYPLVSPIDGTIIEKHLSLGEAVKDDADCFILADLSSVWAEIVVYAGDLKRINKGQHVTVRSEDLDLEVEGQIAFVGALVGEQTRTARAVVEIPNPDRHWRPGLIVAVVLHEEAFPVPVAVPLESVQTLGQKLVVFVKEGDAFEAHPVTLGRKDAEWVEVVDGLKADQDYVIKGAFLLKADLEKSSAAEE